MRRILLAFVMICVVLLVGCKTIDPIVQQRIVVPDLSAYRIDAYELFPLIAEPQTDADIMYNSLVMELDGALTNAYADMLLRQVQSLSGILGGQ